jgi:hypothetical protein
VIGRAHTVRTLTVDLLAAKCRTNAIEMPYKCPALPVATQESGALSLRRLFAGGRSPSDELGFEQNTLGFGVRVVELISQHTDKFGSHLI